VAVFQQMRREGVPPRKSYTHAVGVLRIPFEIVCKLSSKKSSARSAFQVTFSPDRIGSFQVSFIINQFPRSAMGRCKRIALNVLLESLPQICRIADVKSIVSD
jgi:hypothetical protein